MIVSVMAKDTLPYDEGNKAFNDKVLPENNPYAEDDWRHDEWYLGWSHGEECDTTGSWDWSTDSFTNS